MRWLLRLQKGIRAAIKLLRTLRPDLVICTGGYASAATGFASVLLRIPTILEEQNVLPGRVNRLLSHLASVTCVGFKESLRFLPAERCRVTGIPLRKASMEGVASRARLRYCLPEGRPVILVLGGSQGARSINQAVLPSAPLWVSQGYALLHSTGQQHYEEVVKEVQKMGLQKTYTVVPFLDPIGDAYAVASLVICRAGAGTLAEITYWGLPSLLIPYPYSADQHQWFNAQVMQKEGASLLLKDSELKQGALTNEVLFLLEDEGLRSRMREAALALAHPQAREEIVQLAQEIIGEKRGKKERGEAFPAGKRDLKPSRWKEKDSVAIFSEG